MCVPAFSSNAYQQCTQNCLPNGYSYNSLCQTCAIQPQLVRGHNSPGHLVMFVLQSFVRFKNRLRNHSLVMLYAALLIVKILYPIPNSTNCTNSSSNFSCGISDDGGWDGMVREVG